MLSRSKTKKRTYRKQRGSMLCNLHHLNRSIVPSLDAGICGKRHLRQTDCSRVRVRAGPDDLEGRDHGVAHVRRSTVGAIGAVAEVDVHEGGLVALEPAGLDGDGTACCGPVGSVS